MAVVVIKPYALKNKNLIIQRLKDSGLYIAQTVTRQLPENFVIGTMFENTPQKGLQKEVLKRSAYGPSVILEVKGDDLLKKLFLLTGENTDPNKCSEESIRYLFGEHTAIKTDDGDFYPNAIHRPKNENEKERIEDLENFRHIR